MPYSGKARHVRCPSLWCVFFIINSSIFPQFSTCLWDQICLQISCKLWVCCSPSWWPGCAIHTTLRIRSDGGFLTIAAAAGLWANDFSDLPVMITRNLFWVLSLIHIQCHVSVTIRPLTYAAILLSALKCIWHLPNSSSFPRHQCIFWQLISRLQDFTDSCLLEITGENVGGNQSDIQTLLFILHRLEKWQLHLYFCSLFYSEAIKWPVLQSCGNLISLIVFGEVYFWRIFEKPTVWCLPAIFPIIREVPIVLLNHQHINSPYENSEVSKSYAFPQQLCAEGSPGSHST